MCVAAVSLHRWLERVPMTYGYTKVEKAVYAAEGEGFESCIVGIAKALDHLVRCCFLVTADKASKINICCKECRGASIC